jgi:hypothetical protein
MATRHTIDRLSSRTEALVERLRPPSRRFSMRIENHRNTEAELAAFRKEHGVTENDILFVQRIIRWEDRDWKDAYRMADNADGKFLSCPGTHLLDIQLVRSPWENVPLERKKREIENV